LQGRFGQNIIRCTCTGTVMLLLNNFFVIGINVKVGNLGGAILEALSMVIPIFFLWAGHPYHQ